MKKILRYLLIVAILCTGINQNVNAQTLEKNDMTVTEAYIDNAIIAMNGMQPGEKKIVGEWKIVCQESDICTPLGAYSNTKTESRIYTVTRWKTNTDAFRITQSVSYVVNDAAKTVSISKYDVTSKSYLKDYSVLQKNKIINNNMFNNFVQGSSLLDVDSAMDGTLQIRCTVKVYITGQVDFGFTAF